MSQAPREKWDTVIGEFQEKEHRHYFNFSNAEENPFGMPHIIWVGNGEYRYGKVQKTITTIVVDEDHDGNAVTEKWQISVRWHHPKEN